MPLKTGHEIERRMAGSGIHSRHLPKALSPAAISLCTDPPPLSKNRRRGPGREVCTKASGHLPSLRLGV